MYWKEHLALFSPVLSISSTSFASHHYLPIFCSFWSLSSWRNLYVINFFFLPPSHCPLSVFLSQVPVVGQSVCLCCLWTSSCEVVCWCLWCEIEKACFLKDVFIKILCWASVWWPSHMDHTPSMCFPYAITSSREAAKNSTWWFGLQGNG